MRNRQLASLIPKYRLQPIRNPDEDFHAQMVISSSTELFHSYRVTLAQCAKLSTGNRLLELSKIFAKYLDAYSQQVLFHLLSERNGPQGPSIEDIVVILNTADYCSTTSNQLEERIRSRIDEDLREQVDLQSQSDAFMGIASASVRTLVRKVEIDCEAAWREMRSVPWSRMDSVGDQSPYVYSLTQRVRDRSSEILKLIHKPQYARAFCDHLVDSLTNSYMSNIVLSRPISETGAEQMLLDSYVLKKSFTELLTLNTEAATGTSSGGGVAATATPNPAFVKRVNASMSNKLDPLLKTLQVRSSPAEGLVQAYLIHIRDRSEVNFKKILEIKGITKRQDQAHLLELFLVFRDSGKDSAAAANAEGKLSESNPVIAGLSLTGPVVSSAVSSAGGLGRDGGGGGGSGVMSTSSGAGGGLALPGVGSVNVGGGGRFDPSSFGSALMNVARDGVDRFGTPSLVGGGGQSHSRNLSAGTAAGGGGSISTTIASRATTPPPPPSSFTGTTSSSAGMVGQGGLLGSTGEGEGNKQSLNENLKNIGKFFRRDVGGFGGFGKRDESVGRGGTG